jgi:D-tagatose-1,6-bisphosphate aldolase subunit GatZ/KbaZ
MNSLINVVTQHKNMSNNGIYSVCSAHPLVIEASLIQALQDNSLLLIEATSNQVDQFGGYTGMTPQNFHDFVIEMAESVNFPINKLIFGGDHLGPNRWQKLGANKAMDNADDLIKAYVGAGFKKIHLDCSMSCADDPVPLSDKIVAQRSARLAKIAEDTCIKIFGQNDIAYIIGTEVPVPGGAAEELQELEVTSPAAARKTLACHKAAFEKAGVIACWDRVVGLVVQPGVEFDHTRVIDYKSENAQSLSQIMNDYPHMVFEAHSTDYQTNTAYKQLVNDHFAILKVGPALTFALREALFNLCAVENEMYSASERSNLKEVIDQQMLLMPDSWNKYYHGDAQQQHFARYFSFSDRIRYYWPDEKIIQAQNRLFENLSNKEIPLPLLSQYLPEQFAAVREKKISSEPKQLVIDKIRMVLRSYAQACNMNTKKVEVLS